MYDVFTMTALQSYRLMRGEEWLSVIKEVHKEYYQRELGDKLVFFDEDWNVIEFN